MSVKPRSASPWKAREPEEKTTSTEMASPSFEEAFQEHWSGVYSFLVRLVGDHAEAEDLALETFLRLYRQPPAEQASLGGWLHRVAANLGLNALRSWKRRQQYEETAGRLDWLEAPENSPAEIFAVEEERRRVRLVLSEMEPRQARLLLMRHSGMAYREIAATLNLSPTSIGPLLARAEDEFERRYRRTDGDAGPTAR